MAYKVFTNGSPLPASDLNTYLMNQSVMVFANSTARSAALTSPTEGMVSYLEDTNALEVYNGASWVGLGGSPITTQGDLIIGNVSGIESRLAIGADGTYLKSNGTTASWGALSTGQSWTSIASGNIPTGATTWDISSFAAYDKYMIRLRQLSSANGDSVFTLRPNNDSAGNYSVGGIEFIGSTPGNYQGIQSSMAMGNMSASAGSEIQGAYLIEGAQSSGSKKFTVTSWGAGRGYVYQGIWNNSAAITSFRITSSTGNIDAGTYEFWGSN